MPLSSDSYRGTYIYFTDFPIDGVSVQFYHPTPPLAGAPDDTRRAAAPPWPLSAVVNPARRHPSVIMGRPPDRSVIRRAAPAARRAALAARRRSALALGVRGCGVGVVFDNIEALLSD